MLFCVSYDNANSMRMGTLCDTVPRTQCITKHTVNKEQIFVVNRWLFQFLRLKMNVKCVSNLHQEIDWITLS